MRQTIEEMTPATYGLIENDKKENDLFVASLAKGFLVLECFRNQREGLTLTEITVQSKIGKSAAQRAVATLHKIGYLAKNERTKTYRLSPKILTLCWDYLSGSDLSSTAMPFVRQLSERFGETVNLSERIDDQLVVIGRSPGKQVLTINVGIGTRYPLISTAPGLVLLAFSPESQMKEFIEAVDLVRWTDHTVMDKAQLSDWIGQIRMEGFAIANQQMHEGEISMAAPIMLNDSTDAIAVINMSVPTSRWNFEDAHSELAPAVAQTACSISKALSQL
ncbi:IclR family transcriptional regulator [Paenochrobactrum pullorum]|uniref:IclR family transcriptional regulator n=1 Tax=Paenochrobactrum pullorum TaxID=1324351 RepID=UPI0035BC3998